MLNNKHEIHLARETRMENTNKLASKNEKSFKLLT